MNENKAASPCPIDIEEIRARHRAAEHHLSQTVAQLGAWMMQAHTDRATLLALVDRLVAELAEIRAWTDDNERDLNTAVADTMWHWDTRDEGPLDPDDAVSLTEALKIHLKDNGFRIVRAV
jgi:NTP pyrophosphatase (non-canonical NTP hydrolase)